MKHAFLILAHNNYWQLTQLVKLLDYDSHDLYIHIDKRCRDFDKEVFDNIISASKSRIYIYQEYRVYWGDYSIVEAELFLFNKAYSNCYDYYHVISGEDLPLKTNAQIDAFFEKNNGMEFIDFHDKKLLENPEIGRRTKVYHLFQKYKKASYRSALSYVIAFLDRILLALQFLFRVDRTKKLDWTIKYGSQWVSITDGLCKEVLSHEKKIESIFKYSSCPDELFIQTVAYNTEFKNMIYQSSFKNVKSNMRLIDWKRGKPYVFCDKDFDELRYSDALFARKFSEGNDKKIIIKTIEYLAG